MARIQTQGVASYPEFSQASSGGPVYPAIAVINESASQSNPNARLQFGDKIVDKYGNIFVYVRAAGALAAGDVVKQAVVGIGDVPAAGTISASTTARRIFTNITTTIDVTSIGAFLASPGPTTPFVKLVKNQVAVGANTTFDVSQLQIFFGIGKADGDELSAIPTTGEAVALVYPYNVAVCGINTTTGNNPVGVSMGTVTALGGTLIQVQGLAQVKVDGTTDVGAGDLLTTGASGAAIALTAAPSGTQASNELAARVGRALMAVTDNSVKISPVLLQLDGRL